MKEHRRKVLFLALLVAAALPFVAYKVYQCHWYAQALPPELEVAYPVSVGEEFAFRGGCGVAVYSLSDRTLKAVKQDQLSFFESATRARGHREPEDRDGHYYTYQPWQRTPVPAPWTNDGSWFVCSAISSRLESEIVAAAKFEGAYYTMAPKATLLVLPALGYAVFAVND
ncbi:MAG TPA: hypothetical protein VLA61_23595 [Ideonella sp.]|uniref:hypothetical protein n=1 Tax=Ideonella sp. TaxID=1929293 RepID=UPI002BBA39AE|nr:hypothetical protein [Ideonella sp.]HSI51260.1 hypothetical protein [Ideonella sp.]